MEIYYPQIGGVTTILLLYSSAYTMNRNHNNFNVVFMIDQVCELSINTRSQLLAIRFVLFHIVQVLSYCRIGSHFKHALAPLESSPSVQTHYYTRNSQELQTSMCLRLCSEAIGDIEIGPPILTSPKRQVNK